MVARENGINVTVDKLQTNFGLWAWKTNPPISYISKGCLGVEGGHRTRVVVLRNPTKPLVDTLAALSRTPYNASGRFGGGSRSPFSAPASPVGMEEDVDVIPSSNPNTPTEQEAMEEATDNNGHPF